MVKHIDPELKHIADVDKDDFDVDVNLRYLDEDLVIIDNVKVLSEPDVARLKMNAVAFCGAGKATFDLNGKRVLFQKGDVFICSPNVALCNFMVSPDFQFHIIFVSTRMMQAVLRDKIHLWNELIYLRRVYVVKAGPTMLRYMMLFGELMNVVLTEESISYRNEVLISLLRATFLGMAGIVQQNDMLIRTQRRNRAQTVFQDFLVMLDKTPLHSRSVGYYADELCVTPKYLSMVCKTNSGRTAGDWIAERVSEDIRYYLEQTDYSIKEICDILRFPNTSYFGKYVKSAFGLTPGKMRNK